LFALVLLISVPQGVEYYFTVRRYRKYLICLSQEEITFVGALARFVASRPKEGFTPYGNQPHLTLQEWL
jgi:hypothetical protein